MLAKKERFSTKDFSLLKKQNPIKKPLNIGVFCIYKNILPVKFAVVLSKKNFKTAVSRNKHKRIFFNILIKIKKEKQIDRSFVFYPKKDFDKDILLHAIMTFICSPQ